VGVSQKAEIWFPVRIGAQEDKSLPVEIKNRELEVKLNVDEGALNFPITISGVQTDEALKVKLDIGDSGELPVKFEIPEIPLIPIAISGAAAIAAVIAGIACIVTAVVAARSAKSAAKAVELMEKMLGKHRD